MKSGRSRTDSKRNALTSKWTVWAQRSGRFPQLTTQASPGNHLSSGTTWPDLHPPHLQTIFAQR